MASKFHILDQAQEKEDTLRTVEDVELAIKAAHARKGNLERLRDQAIAFSIEDPRLLLAVSLLEKSIGETEYTINQLLQELRRADRQIKLF